MFVETIRLFLLTHEVQVVVQTVVPYSEFIHNKAGEVKVFLLDERVQRQLYVSYFYEQVKISQKLWKLSTQATHDLVFLVKALILGFHDLSENGELEKVR